eukprot:Nk52_evm3s54 gene=Nk52_evmTU3s54
MNRIKILFLHLLICLILTSLVTSQREATQPHVMKIQRGCFFQGNINTSSNLSDPSVQANATRNVDTNQLRDLDQTEANFQCQAPNTFNLCVLASFNSAIVVKAVCGYGSQCVNLTGSGTLHFINRLPFHSQAFEYEGGVYGCGAPGVMYTVCLKPNTNTSSVFNPAQQHGPYTPADSGAWNSIRHCPPEYPGSNGGTCCDADLSETPVCGVSTDFGGLRVVQKCDLKGGGKCGKVPWQDIDNTEVLYADVYYDCVYSSFRSASESTGGLGITKNMWIAVGIGTALLSAMFCVAIAYTWHVRRKKKGMAHGVGGEPIYDSGFPEEYNTSLSNGHQTFELAPIPSVSECTREERITSFHSVTRVDNRDAPPPSYEKVIQQGRRRDE